MPGSRAQHLAALPGPLPHRLPGVALGRLGTLHLRELRRPGGEKRWVAPSAAPVTHANTPPSLLMLLFFSFILVYSKIQLQSTAYLTSWHPDKYLGIFIRPTSAYLSLLCFKKKTYQADNSEESGRLCIKMFLQGFIS